jgi:hypothetical protein
MNYQESISAVNTVQAHYFRLCELNETDDAIGAVLEILHHLKAQHKAKFGTLVRVDGEWI